MWIFNSSIEPNKQGIWSFIYLFIEQQWNNSCVWIVKKRELVNKSLLIYNRVGGSVTFVKRCRKIVSNTVDRLPLNGQAGDIEMEKKSVRERATGGLAWHTFLLILVCIYIYEKFNPFHLMHLMHSDSIVWKDTEDWTNFEMSGAFSESTLQTALISNLKNSSFQKWYRQTGVWIPPKCCMNL